jgi:hypothetical protein
MKIAAIFLLILLALGFIIIILQIIVSLYRTLKEIK